MSITRTDSQQRVVNRHFLRHYAVMVAVMFAGMGVLYLPTELLLGAFGSGWGELGDAAMLGAMGATMTVPMVAWMRLRMAHGWQPSLEMAGASLTVLELDDELEALWDAPVDTPALRWGV